MTRWLPHDHRKSVDGNGNRRYQIWIAIEKTQQCIDATYRDTPNFSCRAVRRFQEHPFTDGEERPEEFHFGPAVETASLINGLLQYGPERVWVGTRAMLQPCIVED